jgi:hypothetical protein
MKKCKRQRNNWKQKNMEPVRNTAPKPRTFEHFPQDGKTVCPICNTNNDRPCFLIQIDDTTRDGNCEAQPTHIHCITDNLDQFCLNIDCGAIYLLTGYGWIKNKLNIEGDQNEKIQTTKRFGG